MYPSRPPEHERMMQSSSRHRKNTLAGLRLNEHPALSACARRYQPFIHPAVSFMDVGF